MCLSQMTGQHFVQALLTSYQEIFFKPHYYVIIFFGNNVHLRTAQVCQVIVQGLSACILQKRSRVIISACKKYTSVIIIIDSNFLSQYPTLAIKETCCSSKFSEGSILQLASSNFSKNFITISAFSKVNYLEFKSSEFYLAGMLNQFRKKECQCTLTSHPDPGFILPGMTNDLL